MLKIIIAQLNFTVGDFSHNTDKILTAIETAKHQHQADLIIFPELAISSYPLEDLLHRPDIYPQINRQLERVYQAAYGIDVIVGYPEKRGIDCFNSAAWIRDGKTITIYHKQLLPNYGVFDEYRYFKAGNKPAIVEIKGIKCGILICEDLWHPEPLSETKTAGAQCIISLNSSPYNIIKPETRLKILKQRISETELPIVYVNLVGGQDELIFDGQSLVLDAKGELIARAPTFSESIFPVEINNSMYLHKQTITEEKPLIEEIYRALVLGVHDYIGKNGFKKVIIGLSGGIDSALTLAIAADALGAENVTAVLMPSPYTAKMSIDDAIQEAKNLGTNYYIIPIEKIYASFESTLAEPLANTLPDITEENLQARIRATLLMAISNKKNELVLTTSNKSEIAVGYATIYGDMAGGFCVLKDVFKMRVYELSRYRNTISPVIPDRVIDRPPSAELRHNQKDEDSLPPYFILDQILKMFIEQDCSVKEIKAAGFDEETIQHIIKMVLRSEYKRRQAPPGIRITQKAFGRDRRYPITSKYDPLKNNNLHE